MNHRLFTAVAVPLLVAVALLLAACQPVPPSTPSAPPASTPTAGGFLRVGLVEETPPFPSGVRFGVPDPHRFLARLTTAAGDPVAFWSPLPGTPGSQSLAPGDYRLVVWAVLVADTVETGAQLTTAPIVPCSTALTIRPNATTRITVTFVSLAVACSLTTA